LGKEDISMAKPVYIGDEPAKHYWYRLMEDTKYYREVPGEGAKPEGVFKAGTRLAGILDIQARFQRVNSDTHVKAWIPIGSPLLIVFRPTDETTEDTPYWFEKTPDIGRLRHDAYGQEPPYYTEGPPDGTLPEGTKVTVTNFFRNEMPSMVQWIEGGPEAWIDVAKHPLKPLYPTGRS
jgi:hypothetical protein